MAKIKYPTLEVGLLFSIFGGDAILIQNRPPLFKIVWAGFAGPHNLRLIMKLSKEEVFKITQLSKLKLSSAEVEKFRGQLSDILTYIDKLKELDTSKVKPTSQVTGLKNVFHKDSKIDQSRYVKSKKGQYFETKAIL